MACCHWQLLHAPKPATSANPANREAVEAQQPKLLRLFNCLPIPRRRGVLSVWHALGTLHCAQGACCTGAGSVFAVLADQCSTHKNILLATYTAHLLLAVLLASCHCAMELRCELMLI